MAMKLYQNFPSSTPLLHSLYQNHHDPKPYLHVHSKPPKRFSLSATPPTFSNSPNSISEEAEQTKQRLLDPDADKTQVQKREETQDSNDPTIRIFKSAYNDDEEEEIAKIGSDPRSKRAVPSGVAAEILQIARNLAENATLGECLGRFEKRVGEEDCAEILGLMGEEALLMSCLCFFEWMGLQEPSLVTARACTVIFPLLGSNGMGEEVMALFQSLPLDKEFLNVSVYGAAMAALFFSGRYEDAWKVNEAMEANNIHPNHVTCFIVITLMRNCGRSAKDAWDYFKKIDRRGIDWGPEVLGALVKSFCDEGLKAEALIVVSEMEKKGVSPNTSVYCTLMDAYVKSSQVEEAEGLFAKMKAKGLALSSFAYNILIDAYSRRMQPEIVENLMVEMKGVGLKPNAKSYASLIRAYGRQKGMSEKAADAFFRMKKVGIKPTSDSYTALIQAYTISRWRDKAYATFENMQKEGIKPTIETYTALLDASRCDGDTEMLMKIWKTMLNEKTEGMRIAYNTLVDGFAKRGHYAEAREVISEFGKMGLRPTVMTYNMLMNAYARGGQESKLTQLLKEMENLDLKPDSYTYSTIIYAYVHVRDYKRAMFYHKKMVKSGQVPDARQHEKLRGILDSKAASKNKYKDKGYVVSSEMGMAKAKRVRRTKMS